MLKPSIDTTSASFNMRCGECLYFNTGPKLYASECSELGVQDFAPAPKCFVPNTIALVEACESKIITMVGDIAKACDAQTLRLLSYQLSEAAEVSKSGFNWGEKVYFSLGGDYLTHYFAGYVIGQHEHGRFLVVSSKLRNSKSSTQCIIFADRCRSSEAWAKHAKELAQQNRIAIPEIDRRWPKYKRHIAELLTIDGKIESDYNVIRENIGRELYEPPSLDKAPEEVRNLQNKKAAEQQKNLPKKPAKTKFKVEADGTLSVDMTNSRSDTGTDGEEPDDVVDTEQDVTEVE